MTDWSDTATHYEICTKVIEYLYIEQRLVNAFKETSRRCSPAEGWDRVFTKTLTYQASSKKFEVPDNICRCCLDFFINPTPEFLLLQAQQRSLEPQLTILRCKLQNLPESGCICIFIRFDWPLTPIDELVELFIIGDLTAFDFFEAIFDLFWEHLIFDSHLLLERIHSNSTRRRPPPRRRRRSCASLSNPRPQPSILSENLSRFAVSVCKSSRSLPFQAICTRSQASRPN
jgi:hypothetical protein